MYTTLNRIRAGAPCERGWTKLLSYLSKTKADDEPLSIAAVLDSNGLDDARWCLVTADGTDEAFRAFAVNCAQRAEHLLVGAFESDALAVAERASWGQATSTELSQAWSKANKRFAELMARPGVGAAQLATAEAVRDTCYGEARSAAIRASEMAEEAIEWAYGAECAEDERRKQADELRRICARNPSPPLVGKEVREAPSAAQILP